MSVDSAIRHFRKRQSDLFSDACTITEPADDPVFDPNTGDYTTPEPTEVYQGACLVRPQSMTEVEAGETQVTLNRFIVKLPVDTAVELDHTVTIDSSTYDAGLVSRSMIVIDIPHDGLQVCRRVVCEEDRG